MQLLALQPQGLPALVRASHAVQLQSPESAVAIYTFNKHAIKHHFCPKCGCAPFGLGESRGTPMAAVNVRCLEGVELGAIKRQFVDGRSF
jgi:hypothetical protein